MAYRRSIGVDRAYPTSAATHRVKSRALTDPGSRPVLEPVRSRRWSDGYSRKWVHLGSNQGPLANPKMGELPGARQRPAERQRSRAGWSGNSGGGLEGDGVAERFELADVVTLAAVRVDAAGVEPRIRGRGNGSRGQTAGAR